MNNSEFSQDSVLRSAARRLKRKIATAEVERNKANLKAKAREQEPNYDKILKWLKGIGEIVDDRIKIHENVLNFMNIDNG